MATYKRHFDWFACDIKLTLSLADQVRTVYTSIKFYSELPLSVLSGVKISRFLPNLFCSAELSFRVLEPVLSPDFTVRAFHMRSSQDVVQYIVRHIIYTLTIDKLIYEFQVDKTL